jgi:hypothetical protein
MIVNTSYHNHRDKDFSTVATIIQIHHEVSNQVLVRYFLTSLSGTLRTIAYLGVYFRQKIHEQMSGADRALLAHRQFSVFNLTIFDLAHNNKINHSDSIRAQEEKSLESVEGFDRIDFSRHTTLICLNKRSII